MARKERLDMAWFVGDPGYRWLAQIVNDPGYRERAYRSAGVKRLVFSLLTIACTAIAVWGFPAILPMLVLHPQRFLSAGMWVLLGLGGFAISLPLAMDGEMRQRFITLVREMKSPDGDRTASTARKGRHEGWTAQILADSGYRERAYRRAWLMMLVFFLLAVASMGIPRWGIPPLAAMDQAFVYSCWLRGFFGFMGFAASLSLSAIGFYNLRFITFVREMESRGGDGTAQAPRDGAAQQ